VADQKFYDEKFDAMAEIDRLTTENKRLKEELAEATIPECYYCGWEPDIVEEQGKFYVKCSYDDCFVETKLYETKAEAVEAWFNNRPEEYKVNK